MRGSVAKKIRREVNAKIKANWLEYVSAICQWPLRARLRFARDIIFHAKRYKNLGRRL